MTLQSSRLFHWARLLSKFVSIQLVVQALSLASGIFLVRTLNQQEYAYFSIAASMQGALSILADMGISFGLSSIGGKVWKDKYRFGQLINTALQLRQYLAVFSIAVVTPISIWLLLKNGADLFNAISITLIILIGFNFQMTASILEIVPRLHSQIDRLQKLDLYFHISRLFFIAIAYLTLFNSTMSVVAGTVALGIRRVLIGKIVIDSIDRKASLNKDDRAEIIKIIKQSAPNTFFFCFESQITVWLMSTFGKVQNVAEIAALGRLSIIFTIIGSVLNGIILPSFSRCQSPDLLLRRYLQILVTAITFAMFLFGLSIAIPEQILWIIGPKYAHLKPELYLVMISSGLSFIANTMWGMNASKAWIASVWLYIPSTIFVQVIGLLFLDVSTLKGAIFFGMSSLVPAFCLQSYMTYKGLKNYNN